MVVDEKVVMPQDVKEAGFSHRGLRRLLHRARGYQAAALVEPVWIVFGAGLFQSFLQNPLFWASVITAYSPLLVRDFPLTRMRKYQRTEYGCAISLVVSPNVAGIPFHLEVSAMM